MPGGGSENPFGCTGGIGCTGRPAVGAADGVRVGVGGSVVATTLGVGVTWVPAWWPARPGREGTGCRPPGRASGAARPGRTPSRVRRSDRAVTPRAYVVPTSYRASYALRAPQTAAREHGLTCPVALIRTTTESAGTWWAEHHGLALGQVDPLADRRRLPREVGVQRMLVLQAAHQPAAGAGDLQRVGRQVLHLGHPQADRLEVLQEGGAAQVAAAVAQPADQPGRVAGPDLPQVDPRPQAAGQLADQRPGSRPDGGR